MAKKNKPIDPESMTNEERGNLYFSKDYMKPRGKKKSKSNELTDSIIDYVHLNRGAARRVNTQGQYDPTMQKWRTSGMKRGFEDIDAIMPIKINHAMAENLSTTVGVKVAIEVKIGKDKLSDYQKKRRDEVTKAGGLYMVAKDIDTFMKDWDRMTQYYSDMIIHKKISDGISK